MANTIWLPLVGFPLTKMHCMQSKPTLCCNMCNVVAYSNYSEISLGVFIITTACYIHVRISVETPLNEVIHDIWDKISTLFNVKLIS